MTEGVLETRRQQVHYLVPRHVLSCSAQMASGNSEERLFIT
jgi:hypothetical protein